MKKHIAALAAALLTLCSFTACTGKNTGSTPDTSVSQTATEASFDKAEAEKKVTDVINDYFGAINSGDMEKVFEFQYNKEDCEAAAIMSGFGTAGGTSAEALENMLSSYKEGYSGHTITLNSIVSIDSVPAQGYELLDEMYGRVLAIKKLAAQYGGDSGLDIDKITAEYSAMTDFPDGKQNYAEAYDIMTNITFDDTDKEQEMIVFRTDNGSWKIDMTVVNYMQKVEQTDMDNAASEVAGSVAEALLKMKDEGTDTTSTFIISSDDSKNYLIPDDFDMKKFKEYLADTYKGDADASYFFVIADNSVKSGVYVNSEGKMGVYPIGLIIVDDGEGNITYDEPANVSDYTIDELYDMSKSVIDGLKK